MVLGPLQSCFLSSMCVFRHVMTRRERHCPGVLFSRRTWLSCRCWFCRVSRAELINRSYAGFRSVYSENENNSVGCFALLGCELHLRILQNKLCFFFQDCLCVARFYLLWVLTFQFHLNKVGATAVQSLRTRGVLKPYTYLIGLTD